MEEEIEFDRLQIAGIRLSDSICGYFAGDHTITTIFNVKNIDPVLRNIRDFYHSQGALPHLKLASEMDQDDQYMYVFNNHTRKLSNIAKHADRPKDLQSKTQYQHWMATHALRATCIDYLNLTSDLIDNNLAECSYIYETEIGTGTRAELLAQLYCDFFTAQKDRAPVTAPVPRYVKDEILNSIIDMGLRHNPEQTDTIYLHSSNDLPPFTLDIDDTM